MRPALLVVGVILLSSALLLADDHIVQSDVKVNFSTVRTFAFRNVGIGINRPELNNNIVISRLQDAIRKTLVARNVKEATSNPDVFVDVAVGGQEFTVGPFGRAHPVGDAAGGAAAGGRRGRRGDPVTPDSVAFVEGVLVLDLVARDSGLLIWRGVYRDSERDTTKFAEKLPGDANKLLAGYPPKKP